MILYIYNGYVLYVRTYIDNRIDYLHQAVKIQTVVDKVFGGKTVNTVICRECLNVSLLKLCS